MTEIWITIAVLTVTTAAIRASGRCCSAAGIFRRRRWP